MNDDHDALQQLLQASKRGTLHVILHYLYFPTQNASADAAARLRSLGFNTEERLGADGVNWLLLATHEIVPTRETITEAREIMEGLAQAEAGEYDGWEAEVR